jgi:hypothetical protein
MILSPPLRIDAVLQISVDVGGDGSYLLDDTMVASGYTLSADKKTLTNVSGGADYRRWTPTEKAISYGSSNSNIYYWEVERLAAGPAEGNGYCGVVSQSQYTDGALNYNSGENPVSDNSIGYRGNGTVWRDSVQRVTGLAPYGAGDVVMVAFQPSTLSIWFGLNGTWADDPATDAATHVTAGTNPIFYPFVQARDANSGGTIKSVLADFDYPVPSNALALSVFSTDLLIGQAGDSVASVLDLTANVLQGTRGAGTVTDLTANVLQGTRGAGTVTDLTGNVLYGTRGAGTVMDLTANIIHSS